MTKPYRIFPIKFPRLTTTHKALDRLRTLGESFRLANSHDMPNLGKEETHSPGMTISMLLDKP